MYSEFNVRDNKNINRHHQVETNTMQFAVLVLLSYQRAGKLL
jgi:hypothetical protein